MAVLDMDSFDGYVTADLQAAGWSGLGTVSVLAAGRNGTSALRMGDWDEGATRILATPQGTIGLGVAVAVNLMTNTTNTLFDFRDGGTVHVSLKVGTNGSLWFERAGVQIGGATPAGTFVEGSLYLHCFAKVVISDTVGTVDLWLNGDATPAISATGLDTRNGGNATVDRIRLGGVVNVNGAPTYDDFYLTDGANLGDCRVESRLPNGNGNSSQMLGSDGNSTDNYLLVDEAAPNSDTDYVGSPTVTEKDTYTMQDATPATGTVHAIKVTLVAKKSDAGSRSFASVVRLSGTEADSADRALSTSYAYYSDIRETKPGGGAWSISDWNNVELGVKVTV